MASKLDIPLKDGSVTIVKKYGTILCDIIDTKFGCVTTIKGLELEDESSTSYRRRPPTISPENRFEFVMRSGVKVSVWKADLTHFRADAVVNAANEDLKHYGGLAQALSTAGGPQIQMESDDFVKKCGKLPTGKTVVLDAGSLPCKKIIHAVGPELSMSPSRYEVQKAKSMLETTIWSILNRVEEYHLADVAIPAISSGLFHYPLPDCAHTIVAPTPTISLCGLSDETTREAEKWLNDLLSVRSHTIENNFISHFSERDHMQLSRLAENGLVIEEFMTQGHACIAITGEMKKDCVVAALKVEAMLCKIQKEFISEEEGELQMLSQTELPSKRETVDKSSKEFSHRFDAFIVHGLRVTKV
ncbi:hypothetical protein XENOCAPTIV_017288 [Xenoophorus captivus]|uniref:Macro domain-containing protein n=1 Tax=Xenoophorus captivus TaxID=1517983 RepID=A0ABV0RZG6_9TELE